MDLLSIYINGELKTRVSVTDEKLTFVIDGKTTVVSIEKYDYETLDNAITQAFLCISEFLPFPTSNTELEI